MNSLADQLKAKGIVSEKEYNKRKKQELSHDQMTQGGLKHKFKGTKGIVAYDEIQLDLAETANDFRHVAKNMLVDDHETITMLIKKVHEFRDRTGNKRIVWFFYNVRDGLKNCPAGRHVELLQRMFRRSSPKFELPR
ncbi:hypothetical protein KAI92_03090 [Candidatus Parcubacteria bacterium]|nr:hypothetical protein [Candidatus Parcubacteria bacterium]